MEFRPGQRWRSLAGHVYEVLAVEPRLRFCPVINGDVAARYVAADPDPATLVECVYDGGRSADNE